jgi:hypothetical protein
MSTRLLPSRTRGRSIRVAHLPRATEPSRPADPEFDALFDRVFPPVPADTPETLRQLAGQFVEALRPLAIAQTEYDRTHVDSS